MIFTRLELDNYGLFRGQHQLDLTPKRTVSGERKNIILFGGKNGAGKTTLLEAVRLCLYGQRSQGTRVRRKDYEDFLKARIHRTRDPALSPDAASVALEFEHVHSGETSAYRVERSWRNTGTGLEEHLMVLRDGEELAEFDQQHWEDFIKELVPPGVSQLFFFDGEKIQALAEEEGDGSELGSSIKALLGLDLTDRLAADLSVYLRRHDGDFGGESGPAGRLETLNREKGELQDSLKRLKQDRAQVETRAAVLKKEVQAVEDRISREGGSFARHREELISNRAQAEEESRAISATVRELCAGLLPFALIPERCERLGEVLLEDQRVREKIAVKQLLGERLPLLRERLAGILDDTDTDVLDDVEEQVRATLVPQERDSAVGGPVHPVAEETSRRLLHHISEATTRVASKVRELKRDLERTSRELVRVEEALQKVPEQDVLRPLLQQLRDLHSELAEVEEVMNGHDEEIERHEREIAAIDKRLEKEEERVANADQAHQRLRLVSRVQKAVDEFATRATASKVEKLRDHFRRCFDSLARKDDMIRDVQIDPETFRVTFYDEAGRSLSKSELSAGEKQIYAIAILWALAITSGRPLPFLIDTPLGRLDSDHRTNLVNEYFPYVAHQVVILSTDTEIDRPYFRQLEPFVARAYHLQYDGSENATNVDKGYFWAREPDEHEVESPAA